MSTNVGSQSRAENSSFFTVPGLITPGHRITIGARTAAVPKRGQCLSNWTQSGAYCVEMWRR
jgi:hypothetical protein